MKTLIKKLSEIFFKKSLESLEQTKPDTGTLQIGDQIEVISLFTINPPELEIGDIGTIVGIGDEAEYYVGFNKCLTWYTYTADKSILMFSDEIRRISCYAPSMISNIPGAH